MQPPTRKTNAWGTLVSHRLGPLQQCYPLIGGHRQKQKTTCPGHPPKAIEQTKKPPKYKLGTYQCDTWADDILRQCKKECGQ